MEAVQHKLYDVGCTMWTVGCRLYNVGCNKQLLLRQHSGGAVRERRGEGEEEEEFLSRTPISSDLRTF